MLKLVPENSEAKISAPVEKKCLILISLLKMGRQEANFLKNFYHHAITTSWVCD